MIGRAEPRVAQRNSGRQNGSDPGDSQRRLIGSAPSDQYRLADHGARQEKAIAMSDGSNGGADPMFARLGLRLWVFLCVFLLLFGGAIVMMGGCAQLTRFRIRNATGKKIAVTSAHTQKTVHIPDKKAAFVPHTLGDITVTLPDGKTWVYRNLSPLELNGTAFMVRKQYFFFGYEDGCFFRGSSTVNLLVNKDGRLYAIPPDAKDVDVEKLEEPKGFPVMPME
jgi:hypothetical protein